MFSLLPPIPLANKKPLKTDSSQKIKQDSLLLLSHDIKNEVADSKSILKTKDASTSNQPKRLYNLEKQQTKSKYRSKVSTTMKKKF